MVEELNQHSKEHGRHLEELEAQLDKLENDLEKNELEKKVSDSFGGGHYSKFFEESLSELHRCIENETFKEDSEQNTMVKLYNTQKELLIRVKEIEEFAAQIPREEHHYDQKGNDAEMVEKKDVFVHRPYSIRIGESLSELRRCIEAWQKQRDTEMTNVRTELREMRCSFEKRFRRLEEGNTTREEWKWEKVSKTHEEKFEKLIEHGRKCPGEIREINGVRVCLKKDLLIGSGAQSNGVYVGLGKDGSERAIKLFVKAIQGDFAEREKELLMKCKTKQSAHLMKYWYFDDASDIMCAFLIMELCEETLENYVHRSSLEDLMKFGPGILQQILKGLADLHHEPDCILHRDVKPLNILRNSFGNWLLADFGIGRILPDDETTFISKERGTKKWRAVESCSESSISDDGRVRYKTKSDIQVTGMVAFYILTQGKHPFGENEQRILLNLLNGNPVKLNMLDSHPLAKDLISWMLSHDPKDRPSAEEALQHPYLKSKEQQFNLLCGIGNEPHVKKKDVNSDVVKLLNQHDTTDWRSRIENDVLKYLSYDQFKKISFKYTSSWTDCLRLIRNIEEHWKDCPRTEPEAMKVGDPQEYFLNLFPDLVLRVYEIARSCDDLKELPGLKEYFRGVPLESQEEMNDNETDPIDNEDSINDVPDCSFPVTKVTEKTVDVRSFVGVKDIIRTVAKSDLTKTVQNIKPADIREIQASGVCSSNDEPNDGQASSKTENIGPDIREVQDPCVCSSNDEAIYGQATFKTEDMREKEELCKHFQDKVEEKFLHKLQINKSDFLYPEVGAITQKLTDLGLIATVILGLATGTAFAFAIGTYGIGSLAPAVIAAVTFTVTKVDKGMQQSTKDNLDDKVKYLHSRIRCIIMDVARELSRMFEYQVVELKDETEIGKLAECAVNLMLQLREGEEFDRNTLLKKVLQHGKMKKTKLLTKRNDKWFDLDVFRKPGLQKVVFENNAAELKHYVIPTENKNVACDAVKYGYRGQFLELKSDTSEGKDEQVSEKKNRKKSLFCCSSKANDETPMGKDASDCKVPCTENHENCTIDHLHFCESDIDSPYTELQKPNCIYFPMHILIQSPNILDSFNQMRKGEKPSLAKFLIDMLRPPGNHQARPIYRPDSTRKIPDLKDADLSGSDFSHCDFTKSVLEECNFTDVVMLFADLSDARMSHSTLCSTFISHCKLVRTIAQNCKLVDTSLHFSRVEGAHLDTKKTSIAGNSYIGSNMPEVYSI